MEDNIRRLQRKSQLLSSNIADKETSPIQRTPAFIQSLVQSSKFGESDPSTKVKDSAHLFWMEKGVDTSGLKKSLEDGKTKLVVSNSTTLSEYDVEGHIRQYHENAVNQTLDNSQKLFEENCSNRIWKMMNDEFMKTKEVILTSEGKQTTLHSPAPTSNNLPLMVNQLAPKPVQSNSNQQDDISKIIYFEKAIKTIFDNIRDKKDFKMSHILYDALKNSKQDMAGELFCWKMLRDELNLDRVKPNCFASKNPITEKITVLNNLRFLSQEYLQYIRRCIIRARSIQDLPNDSTIAIATEYVNVMCDGKELTSYELDSHSGLPLWMILFTLLHLGCTQADIDYYKEDILRHGGTVGYDILNIITIFVNSLSSSSSSVITSSDLLAITSRIRGVCHRLTGAGCNDMYKILLYSILSNETPYAMNTVIDQNTGNVCIPQQEVLITLQDWLWHKLLVIYGIPKIVVNMTCLSSLRETGSDFTLAGLTKSITECGASHFDPNGTTPFSYIQNLLVIGQWNECITYLLSVHQLISAVLLSSVFYYYGLLQEGENLFITTLTQLINHPLMKPIVNAELIGFVRENEIKSDLCLMLLVQSYDVKELVGTKLEANHRSKAFYDEMSDMNVDEVIKKAASVFNTNNEWEKAVELFILCNNYDHALSILIKKLVLAYEQHLSNKEEIADKTSKFVESIETLPEHDITAEHMNSATVLLQTVHIIYKVEMNCMDDALNEINNISILPHGKSLSEIQRAIRCCEGVEKVVLELLSELILNACYCIAYHYDTCKKQDYIIGDKKTCNDVVQGMQFYRDCIEGYELFVGSTGISIPPSINEQLTQIVLSMA